MNVHGFFADSLTVNVHGFFVARRQDLLLMGDVLSWIALLDTIALGGDSNVTSSAHRNVP